MKKILGFAAFILLMLAFVINNTLTISSYVEEDGFVMPESKLDEYMVESTYNDAEDFDLIEISEFDYISENSGLYYTEDGTQIDLGYPTIIREGNAIKYINGGAYLISDTFDFAPTTPGTIVANQTYFNADGATTDESTYILSQLRNGLFVAATEYKIKTQLEEFSISENAIIYFDEDFINVYNYNDGTYEFLAIRGLQNATITYDDTTAQYADFYDDVHQVAELVKQEIELEEEKEVEVTDKIEAEQPEDTSGNLPDPVPAPENPPEIESPVVTEPTEEEEVESEPAEPTKIPYQKPEVEVTDISAWVYSINGELEITDPASRMTGSVTFYVYNEKGTLILRDQTKKSGDFSFTTLPPDSTLVVEAFFEYYNEYNVKITEQCLDMTVLTTLPFEGNVSDISLTFENDTTLYSEAIGVIDTTMTNTTDYNPEDDSLENFYKNFLPYVYSMNFVFENVETGEIIESKIGSSIISKLRSGDIVDFTTSNDLDPNTTYTYSVEAFDRYGNEFTLVPDNSGEYTTCKELPEVDISVKSRKTDVVVFELTLNDEYNAITSEDYTVVIMYGEEKLELEYSMNDFDGISQEVSVSLENDETTLNIYNLPYSVTLEAYAYASYDLNDNNGEIVDETIGYLSFYSAGIPSGVVTFNNTFVDIGGTAVTVEMVLAQSSTADLVTLLSDFTMNFETDGQALSYTITKELFNSVNIDEAYDEELGALVIQEGDEKSLTPEILLYATREAIEENGAWQTFLNTALYGSTDASAGKVSVELMQGTLLASSVYEYDMESVADLGSNIFDVTSYVLDDEFTTLKQEPIIYYEDYFIASDFIEIYDLEIMDEYQAITAGVYSVQLYEDGSLINTATLNTSTVEDMLRFDMLSLGHTYTLMFVAQEYNLSAEDDLAQSQYVMKELSFEYDEGLQASIELSNITYNYEGIDTSGDYGYVGANATLNQAYNVSTNELEEKEGYFVTDYLEYNCKSKYYTTFKDFADYGESVALAFYKVVDGEYVLVADTTWTTRPWLFGFSEYSGSSQFNYTTAQYVRVTGTMNNIDKAYYYQYTNDDLEIIIDTSMDDSMFVRDVQLGTTSSDFTSATYSSSGFIDVTAGELLEVKQSADYIRIYYFDENYDYLGDSQTQHYQSTATLEVPSNACYARVLIQTSILDSDTGYIQIARIKDADVISTQATMHWTMEDDREDAFFLLNEYNDDATYTITKYQAVIQTEQVFSEEDIAYEHVETLEYDSLTNIDVDVFATETVVTDMAYKYEISIIYHDRTVVLDDVTFTTDSTIKFIDSISDFEKIEYNKFATYYVVNDIVESEGYTTNYIYFGGLLDFQGHSITLTRSGTTNEALFQDLYIGGEIRNVEIILNDGDVCRTFLNTNYGTVSNIKYTINKSIDSPILSNLIDYNSMGGVIDNFIIEFNGDTFFYNEEEGENSAIFVRYNAGTISNGYIYNTDKDGAVYLHDNAGVLTYSDTSQSTIKNVYAICDIYSNYNQAPSGETWYSGVIAVDGDGRVSNVFGVSTRYQFFYDSSAGLLIDQGYTNEEEPLFSSISGSTNYDDYFEDVYLLSEYSNYVDIISEYFEEESLHDTEWYDESLGEDSNFLVDDLVSQGFYPILDLNDSMMDNQVFIELPELNTVTRPDYLYSSLVGETLEYTTVEMVFNNTANTAITSVTVDGLTSVITNQELRDDLYVITVRLSNPSTYVDEYTFTSFGYRSTSTTINVEVNKVIEAPFYYSIDEIADFVMMENNTRWNFRLTSDIDFEDFNGSWSSEVYVNNTFYGTFDGGIYDAYGQLTSNNYTIKNIDLTQSEFGSSGLFFENITYGKVSNMNFDNITWIKETGSDIGIIYRSYYSTLENVHIDGVTFTSSYRAGTLASITYGSTISYCSASNVYITNGTSTSGFRAGGLLGYASYTNISNSYVQDFFIETHDLDLSTGMAIGGLVAEISTTGTIDSCYTIGRIENPSYNGGIVGTGVSRIDNCYSDVLIVADGDFNGGISGGSSSAYTTDSLSLGDLIVMQETPIYSHRLSATDTWYYSTNNYGYVGQTLNSENPGLDYTDGVLTYDELTTENTYINKIAMGTEYDYSQLDEGILPKIYDNNGDLLDNQIDNYLNSEELSIEVTYSNYDNSTYYDTTIRIEHEGYEVDEVHIEGMNETEKVELDTGTDDASVYDIRSTKEHAFDIYIVTATLISTTDGSQVDLITIADYGAPVYWEVYNMESWQLTMENYGYTNENIKIIAPIDFSEYENTLVMDDLSLNRLEGSNTTDAVLYNIDIDDGTVDNLISSIYASFSNITIRDSSIDFDTTSYKYMVGFVGVVQGTSSNLIFTNNSISAANVGTTSIGMISSANGLISNVVADTITVDIATSGAYRTNYTGSIIGKTTSGVQNVEASNITISALNGERVGGIVGEINKSDTSLVDLSNITIDNVTVKGSSYVGGVVGYSTNCSNLAITAKDVEVDGTYGSASLSQDMVELGYYVGGVAGYTSTTIDNADIDGYSFEDIEVVGKYRVGGIVGTGTVKNADIQNITVTGEKMVGGVGGYVNSETYYINIYNADVTATDSFAGIIGGRTYQIFYTYVFDCDVEAASHVGGLSGFIGNYAYSGDIITQTWGAVYYSGVIDSSITATSGSHAGGLVGYIYSYGSSLLRSYVKDCEITAGTGYAGGLAGEISLENIYYCYVTGGSVTSNTGSYTGGLVGMINHKIENENENYAGKVERSYSATTVKGSDYVGGIFGYYRSDPSSTETSNYRTMFSLVNYSDIIGSSNVYGVGYFEHLEDETHGSEYYIHPSYFGAIVSYDEATINGNIITENQVSNISDNSKFYLVSLEEVSNYSLLGSALTSGGLYSYNGHYSNYLANSGELGTFDIFIDYKIEGSTKTFDFDLNNINLPDGNYKISIGNSTSNSTAYVNEGSLTISSNDAEYSFTTTSSTTDFNFNVVIMDESSNVLYSDYYDGYKTYNSYEPIYVDGIESNYESSTTNQEITLSVEGTGSYSWYRIYDGQGYDASKIDVTSYADGNSLTIDIPGIYYAVSGSNYSELFVYETNLYLPILSSTTTSPFPYQGGYSYVNGKIVNLYNGDLSFKGTVLGMVSREGVSDSAIAINDLASLPEYDVYASGIDTINIEFDNFVDYEDTSEFYSVRLISGGQEKEYTINSRVMTFAYDYSDDLEVVVFSQYDETSSEYTVEDLQNLVSVYGSDYYYQSTNGVTNANGVTLEGDFVHVFEYYAINEDGIIYDLETLSIADSISDNLGTRATVALYESDYEEDTLYTYSSFTYNLSENLEIEEVIFNNDGVIYGFSGSTQRDSLAYIADSYNEESYQAYVSSSGYLIDTTGDLQLPDDFKSYNIVEISDTYNSDSHIVLVRYLYGQIVAFDYTTGEEIELEETSIISLTNYLMASINSLLGGSGDEISGVDEAYDESKNLEDAIENATQSEIDSITGTSSTGDSTPPSSNNTIVIFNEEVLSFEVYFIDELVSYPSKQVTSVQEKIEVASEAGYEGTLNNLVVTTAYVSESTDNTVNIVIFVMLTVSVGGLLGYLKKSSKKEDII